MIECNAPYFLETGLSQNTSDQKGPQIKHIIFSAVKPTKIFIIRDKFFLKL